MYGKRSLLKFNGSWSYNSMGYWTRYIYCTIILTMALISTSDAQPTLTMWNLDLDDNKIILQFGIPSLLNPSNNGMSIDCTAIFIGPVAGDIGMAVQLLPSVVGLQVDETLATCDLGMEFRSMLNVNPSLGTDPSNTYLYYDIYDIDGSAMTLLVDSGDVAYSNTMGIAATQVVSDSTSPAIAGFEYLDLDEGVIVFSFTQPINVTTFNFSDLSLQNSPIDEATSRKVFLTDGSCENGCEIGQYITLRMAQTDLEKLKLEEGICVSISTCYPHHTDLLVEDFGGNLITTYRFGLNYLMKHLILDTTPAILVGCDLNLSLDDLVLVFDEPINVSTYNPLGITLRFSKNITLTSASSVRGPSSYVVVVDLGLDADKLKILTPAIPEYDIFVSLLSSPFEDIAGNSVQSVLRVCNFTNDTYSPRVLSFHLDLNSNLLQVSFSELILVGSLDISGFKLIDSSSVTVDMHMINLSDSFVVDSDDLPVDGAVRMTYIAFGSQSLTRIKTSNDIGTAVNNTYLLIDDHSFVDTNGNTFISTGPIAAAAVIADNSPATVVDFSLDMNIGQIALTFNDVVNVSTWHNGEIFIQEAAFTENLGIVYQHALSGIIASNNSNVIILDLYAYNLYYLKEQLNYGTAVDLNSTYLTIRAHAINDIRGVDIIAVTDGNGIIASTYVRDSESPQLISFDLYMNYGQIYFHFDEPIARNSFIPSLFTLQGGSMINTSSSSVNLSSNSTSNYYCYNNYCYYYLPTDVLYLLRRDPNVARDANTTYLVIMQGGVNDTSGNPISMTGPIMVNYYSPGSIAIVSFGQSRYIVNEDDGSVQLLLILSNQLPITVTIEVFNTVGLATREDYGLGPYSVTFLAGITITSLSISIIDDEIFEGNENFMVMFNSSLLPSGIILGDDNNQSTVIILDDESVVVNFIQPAYSAIEANGFVQIELVFSNPSSNDITIVVLSTEASATENNDYDSEPYNVTISAGTTVAAFNISINNDNILESNENFILTVDPSSLPEDVTLGSLFQATVTIVDTDSATVNFTQSVYRFDEDSGVVQLTLVLSNPSSADITVEALNTDESATGGGIDYSSGPYTATFVSGTTNTLFDVTISDNNVYRGNVYFNITINPSSLPNNVIVGDTGQVRVIIVDDDIAAFTVNFSQTAYSVDEDSGLVQPELVLSDSLSTSTTIQVLNMDGSATGQDYESGPYCIIFPAGVTRMRFDVSLISDDAFEHNETFHLSINSSSLPLNVSTTAPDQATVIIINDDFVVIYTVSFNQLIYNVPEDSEVAQVTLALDNPSSTDIAVEVITTNGSAIGRGVDYGSEPYSIIFHAGETDVTLNISIIDDDILENDENFNVIINPTLLPIDVIIANHTGYATVTIVDNDGDTTLPFLPFSSKRQQLGYYLDGVSDIIYISNGFPFGLQTHTMAYVGTNGVISFSRPFYYWYPYPFPGHYYLRKFYVVAPYWADHDIRRDGEVYYEVLEKGQNKNDDSVLNRVNHYIALKTDPDFIGTFMILAEWQNVHPYPYGSNYYYYFQGYYPSIRSFTKQENTYQALVITDGKDSYAIFTYMCDLIQWSGLWRYPTIGYNAGGVLFANHPLTAHEEANQIDCPNNSSQYVNIVYKISADPDTVKKLQSQCQSWYFSDIESYGKNEDILTFSESQIACPCTSLQAWWDRRFWFFTIKDNSFCFIEIFNNTYGGAQECCYSISPQMFGSLVLQGRSSGGLLRYHPWWSWTVNYPNYIEYDRNPQEICCLSAVGYCNLYHERRPPHNCEGYIPQRRTRGRGDPHITALDGRTYTFNGLGEYVLLRENATNFEFQGRTELAPNSNATIFSAFAMRVGGNIVEVGTNLSTGSFTITLDGTDVSDGLMSVGDNVTTSSSFIERSSNNSITVSFPSGVGVTINYTAGLLVYTLEVPSSFEGTTSGLLGNYNNDDSDEFVFRNGTMISNSSSDREIHQFGQSWQITSVESIFTYKTGEGVSTFSNPNHIPPFLDEILSSLMGNSTLTDVCGENVECLFDFAQTGDVEVGMVALAIENETATETQEAFSFPPNITAPETFMATVGEESVYTFTVSSDSQNINVIILHEGEETLPSGVQLNNPDGDSYTITWTPADNTAALNLTIVAADLNMKNISSIFSPVVQLCACANGGSCTTDGLLTNDFSFIVLNCECLEGYDGEFCQNDADGCDTISCLEGQQCFDYPAPQIGAECVCPDGYAADSDSKCVDINECVNRSTIDCTQQCINTPGSYECDCYDGYQAITANATECEDINECEEYNNCHQNCTNTEGSYYCSCYTGFMLEADSISCEADAPCTMNNCSQSCANINGKETCFCIAGYQLGMDNVTCLDIDECIQTPCEQNCTNTIGSFTCSCNSGYELNKNGRSCNDIDECLSGPCPSDLICNNMDGNYSCDCPDGTMSNGTDCILISNVTPSRLFTTLPPNTSQMSLTVSVTSSVTTSSVPLPPEGKKVADDLPIGAIIGIIVGGFVIMLIIVLIIFIVAKRINSKPRKRDRLVDSSQNNWPLDMLSSGSDPINY